MRTTRAAAKRAAQDEAKSEAVPNQGCKNKRPALANISNDVKKHASNKSKAAAAAPSPKVKKNGPLVSPVSTTQKSTMLTTASSSVSADWSQDNLDLSLFPASTEDVKSSLKSEKNIAINIAELESLERRTVRNLHISSLASPRVGVRQAFPTTSREEKLASMGIVPIYTNSSDPLCSIYEEDIYQNHRNAEVKRRPSLDFMGTVQNDVTASMRGILVDWLVEVGEEYKLVPDTLYLTCNYLDRFLSTKAISRSQLQLLGVTCMLLASKYEEIHPPLVEEYCYITDSTYGKEEMIDMEKTVLNNLQFEMSSPTTKTFLRRCNLAGQATLPAQSLQLEFLGNYLAELTLADYAFTKFLPSMVAASVVFLAKLTLFPSIAPWNRTLQYYSGYAPSELKECVLALHGLQKNAKACNLPAIREKYRQPKFKCVSNVTAPLAINHEVFTDLAPFGNL